MLRLLPFAVLSLPLLASARPQAQTEHPTSAPTAETEGPAPDAKHFESHHQIALASGTIGYTAIAETTLFQNDEGKPEAEFFTYAYLADASEEEREARPLTFVFNGGPGSASLWLHMGLVGPKRVEVPSDGQGAGAPPYPLVDNPHTLLAFTDLVFIDPIGTGFSRVVGVGKNEDHWGVDEDAESVARFIRRYVSDQGRWSSPKYVLGESYGGIRGSLLVRELQSGFNALALNGVILISPALDMGLVDGQENDAAMATVLPTYAATAWYHHALPQQPETLEPFLAEVSAWTAAEYVPALWEGQSLSDERREAIAERLHRYTGLSKDYILRANLRVGTDRFRRELLRERGLVVGRLDTRYTGTEPDAVGEVPSGDPMGAGISGAFVAGFQHYLRSELGVVMQRPYEVMSPGAGNSWKRPRERWGAFQGYLDVTPELARGMADNPDLRVFIGSGLFDIATTFSAAEYNVHRSTMDPARVELRNYPAGHMMYVNQPSLDALSRDLGAFLKAQAPSHAVEASY